MISLQTKNIPAAPSGTTVRSALVSDSIAIESEVNRLAGQLTTEINTTAAAAAAQSASAQAAAAATLAQQVVAAALAPSEKLTPISSSFFASNAVVATFLYDTANDSDGGAWRARCQHTSWYNETTTATGNWLGVRATEAAARAVTNAATGDYFQNSTDGLFYSLNATAGVTQVYRGARKSFPARVLVVAEAGRVVLFDATDSALPLWNVIFGAGSWTTGLASSVVCVNGSLYIGTSGFGFIYANFLTEIGGTRNTSGMGFSMTLGLNAYHSSIHPNTSITIAAIVNNTVNSVAATVLPNAPIDPATGLPIPTIAVGTAGGVSVIKDDGTVVTIGTLNAQYKVSLVGKVLFCSGVNGTNLGIWKCADVTVAAPVVSDYYSTYGQVQFQMTDLNAANRHIRTPKGMATAKVAGLAVLVENATTPAAGMAFNASGAFNSGWQVGDSRLATLADTVVGVVTNPATEADRSVKNTPMTVFGSLTKSAVNTGSQLVGYSGFSATNYLQQAYSANLDFAATDWSFVVVGKFAATAAKEVIFCRDSPVTGKLIRLQIDVTTSVLSLTAFDGTTTRTATGATAVDDGTLKHIVCTYSAGTLTIYVNGALYASATGAALATLNNATATFSAGVDAQLANPLSATSQLALLRASATVPSADQIAYMYETERKLFDAGAKCTIDGTSTSVTALSYDDATQLTHVGTSWGRSAFKDLLRVESEATTVGSIATLATSYGTVVQTGATGTKLYDPSKYLRDELLRSAEQRAKWGKELLAQDYTATAAQTAFVLPLGYTPKYVYQQGLLKKFATGAGNWSSSFDGFRWTVTLGTGATLNDAVSIMCTRG